MSWSPSIDAAKTVDHDEAVAVAIERDARVRPHAGHGQLQQARAKWNRSRH